MDAKPQRARALRVQTDENMPPPALPGKTLHQRTKSSPALSTLLQVGAARAATKKVLGEVNANMKVLQPAKDDSVVGKKRGAIEKDGVADITKPMTAFTRPATRPLASKSVSATIVPTSTFALAQAVQKQQQDPPTGQEIKKPAPKKSTKVLKDPLPDAEVQHHAPDVPKEQYQAVPELKPQSTILPKPHSDAAPVQQHEIHKVESVPLHDVPVAKPYVRPASVALNHQISGSYVPETEYMPYLEQQANALRIQQHAALAQLAVQQLPTPQSDGGFQQYLDQQEELYADEEGFMTGYGLYGPDSTAGVTTVLLPKYTVKVKAEIEAAKMFVQQTESAEDYEDEQWDTSMVAEYSEEIFQYMRELEDRMAPNPRYMDQQQEIQWSMRSVLIDWVVQVHQRFNLLPETLFLTVNYIDRFLSCKVVSLGKLQLVGATAIFVASKYEEVNCPTISEIIYMVDGGYTVDELLKAERFMLSMLQFELGWPGPMSFLRRISKADDYDLETRTLAKYFLEITIMDERFLGCTPSFLAAGAHCMARLMLGKGDWSPAHVCYSNYTYGQLRSLLTTMLDCLGDPQVHHGAVFEKYTDKRYKRASTYVAGQMAKGFKLPMRSSSIGPLDGNDWLKHF